MAERAVRHGISMPAGLTYVRCDMRDSRAALHCRAGGIAMLDILYILIGAAFLAACVLYAYACDRL